MKKILIIDDNEEFKEFIRDYFSSIGYDIVLCGNAKDGVSAAVREKPDLIFLDVMMPEKTGIEIIREFQEYEEIKKVPVIVLTGTYLESNMKEIFSIEPNCRAFLAKTVDIPLLEKKVFELIGK